MVTIKQFTRHDYINGREPVLNWYKKAKAEATDLDALLKVVTAKDAVKFMDAYSPLHYSGIRAYVTKPSECDAEKLDAMVADVLNTVALMNFAIDTYKLIKDGASAAVLEEKGYHPHYVKFTVDEAIQAASFPPDSETYELQMMMDELIDPRVGCAVCDFGITVNPKGMSTFHTHWTDPTLGFRVFFNFDGKPDTLVLRGIALDDGDTDEAYRQALSDMLSRLFASCLREVSLTPIRMELAFSSSSYASFLWYSLFERLTAGEIRRCGVCGRYFVANLGDANERGGSPKANCGVNCRQMGFRARKAKKLIEGGMGIEQAAKEAHIGVGKLKTFLELNPIESEGANNG